jgi:hypothetical protein
LIVAVVILLSFVPVLSARMHSRTPSVLAAAAMLVMIAAFLTVLLPWAPAWAAVLGAAIAGPPSREAATKETADVRI